MSRIGWLAGTIVTAALAVVMLGCTKGRSDGPQLNAQGKHPSGWTDTHYVAFNKDKNSCAPCHGSYVDPSVKGTTGIDCFTCHAQQNPPVYAPLHPAGYEQPGNNPFHGATAKQAPSKSGGFSHCAECHGPALDNADNTTVSCMACHTKAPHPGKPWHGPTGSNHANTDEGNAAMCASCHSNGANLDPANMPFRSTAPAGSAPGCFNNTLCHDNAPGHVVDWQLPTGHGVAAIAKPASPSAGLLNCTSCHGADYATGTAPSCFACHTTAPHPAAPWTSSSTQPSHIFTDQANVTACAGCHLANARNTVPVAIPAGTVPGCFNNTMCHGTTP